VSPPTIEAPVINTCGSGLTSCAVTIGSGGSSYFYAAGIGGAFTISAVDFTPDVSVVNGQGLTSVLIGHSTSNTGTFNPNTALFPIIGGIGVSSASYTTQTFSNTAQTSLTGTLTVSQQSLVILVSAASNNRLGSLTSTFTVLKSGSTSFSGVVFADATLSANSYPFTISYSAGNDPTSMGIGIAFYIFPLATPSSTTTSVSCSLSTISLGSTTLCTASVSGSPIGTVTFSSSSSTGSFVPLSAQCTLFLGSCSVSYSDTTAGNPTLSASYIGSEGTTKITVLPVIKKLGDFAGLIQCDTASSLVCAGTYGVPDVQIAAGSNKVMEMVNGEGEIWSKTDSSLSDPQKFQLCSIFLSNCNDTNVVYRLSDPRVLYDSGSSRWFASLVDAKNNQIILIASKGVDPSSDRAQWYTFPPVKSSGTGCGSPDQPTLGISDDKVALSANMYCQSIGVSVAGAEYWIYDKASLLQGSQSSVDCPRKCYDSSFLPNIESIRPAQNMGSGSTLYMVSTTEITDGVQSNNILLFLSITGLPPNININSGTGAITLSIRQLTSPQNPVQPGTRKTLSIQAILDPGYMVQNAVWRNGNLWLSADDGCVPVGDCVRLIEVNTASHHVMQDFDVNQNNLFYFYPAIAIDSSENPLVVFAFSSSSDNPSIGITAQGPTMQSNTYIPPLEPGSGHGSGSCDSNSLCSSGRFGDYFGVATDPTNPSIVWVAGEYINSDTWSSDCRNLGIPNVCSAWSTNIYSLSLKNSLP
jgi:hypothetical protein